MQSINTREMQRSFNKAAEHYDRAAVLQHEVGRRLLSRFVALSTTPELMLDLGSGTGVLTRELQSIYENTQIISVDIAEQMLQYDKSQGNQQVVCADATLLPFSDASVDSIISNLMLQWCPNLSDCVNEMARVLRPSGIVLFTSLGPDTFYELRQAWQAVDDDVHVHDFIDLHHIGDALLNQGFKDPVVDRENITVYYDDVMQIMRDIKAIGAHNSDHRRPNRLTGKSRLQAMINAYENFRTADNTLPVTYEVIYGYAIAPKNKKSEPGVIRIPVSSIKRANK